MRPIAPSPECGTLSDPKMKTLLTLISSLTAVVVLSGCGSGEPAAAEYSKDAFAKQAPPAGYLGNVPKPPAGPPPGAGAPKTR